MIEKGNGAKVYAWVIDNEERWINVINIPKALMKEDFDAFKEEQVCRSSGFNDDMFY
jgi:hypothetical protein